MKNQVKHVGQIKNQEKKRFDPKSFRCEKCGDDIFLYHYDSSAQLFITVCLECGEEYFWSRC